VEAALVGATETERVGDTVPVRLSVAVVAAKPWSEAKATTARTASTYFFKTGLLEKNS